MAEQQPTTHTISELPVDELIAYGRSLGLRLDERMGQGELLRRVRERQVLLAELDRESMLAIVVWARRPVRKSVTKEQLAREISHISRMDFDDLPDEHLVTLARLRGLPVRGGEPRAVLEDRMRRCEPFWDRVRRKRRKVLGSVIGHLVDAEREEESDEYRFLPEDPSAVSLKQRISDQGVMGGIARTLRGVADDYVAEKLDEIEARIDRKLDEIDLRLAEWRDREIANRLRIVKITLIFSILVALLSLGYHYLKSYA